VTMVTNACAGVVLCLRRPKGEINFAAGGGIFPSAAPQFDYLNWTQFYDLGQPVATNWHVTLHSENTTAAENLPW